jgi:predicted ATPase
MARLDRLGPVKEIAQLGAVLGREFSYEVLRAVAPWDDERLRLSLAQLVEAELLYPRGHPPSESFVFKHALVQDAAYQSLLRSTRQAYHRRITQVLVEQFPEMVATHPELLARHYTEAGLTVEAVAQWQRAGMNAIQRSAHAEAIAHLTTGLALLTILPATPERLHQELALRRLLGGSLLATKGYASPEVVRTYTRARELCQQVGETPQLLPVLWGLFLFHLVRYDFQTARDLAQQAHTLVHRYPNQLPRLATDTMLGMACVYAGDFAAARTHLDQAVSEYGVNQHSTLVSVYGQDLGIVARLYLAEALWFLGYPARAVAHMHEAVRLAHDLSLPFDLARTLPHAAMLYLLRREADAVQEHADAAIALCTAQGSSLYLTFATGIQGWALAMRGQAAEGLAQLHRGVAEAEEAGVELLRVGFLHWLAEVYGGLGRVGEAVHRLAEALTVIETGHSQIEADIYRLKGELLWSASADTVDEAEACFQRAISIARRQHAKSWELRAAMGLARLWQSQGKRADARELLAPIYGWFSEGFDTPDLQTAHALLEELGDATPMATAQHDQEGRAVE